MTSARLAPFATLAVTATLALAACGSDDPTTSATPSSSTVTVTSTPVAEAEELTAPEQQEKTAKELAAALPTLKEAPRGFIVDPGGYDANRKSRATADPEECLAVYLDGAEQRAWSREHRSTADGVRYTQKNGGINPPSISVAVTTYDEPYPTRFFDEAGAALADCTKFTHQLTPDGNTNTYTAQNISTPVVGDRAFGVRVGDPDVDMGIDHLWVRSGHNLISVRMITGFRANNEEILEEYATGVLEDLG